MKATTIYIDKNGIALTGIRQRKGYVTSDGKQFYGKAAKERAENHEEDLIHETQRLRYFRNMLVELGIGGDHPEGEEELINLFVREGFIEDTNDVNDVLEKITDFFSLFDNSVRQGLINQFTSWSGRRFKTTKNSWSSSRSMIV